MSDVIINFVGNTEGLKAVEDIFANLTSMDKALLEQYKKTTAEWQAGEKKKADSTKPVVAGVEEVIDSTKVQEAAEKKSADQWQSDEKKKSESSKIVVTEVGKIVDTTKVQESEQKKSADEWQTAEKKKAEGTKVVAAEVDKVIAATKIEEAGQRKSVDEFTTGNREKISSTNKLALSIDELATATKSMDKAVIGGAYKTYLKEIQEQLGLTKKELIEYIQTTRKQAQEAMFVGTDEDVKELALSIEVMNDQLKELGVTSFNTEEKTQTLRQRLKDVKNELVAMADAGKMGTPEFNKLRNEAASLEDQMGDLNTEIRNLASDTRNFDAVVSGISGIAGGYAIAQGAAALFGDESEEVQQALLKVNAAMSILQGLQQIQNVLQSESALMLGIERLQLSAKTLATNIQTASTTGATVAQRALNTAMAASPIGIALLAIGALVAAYTLLNQETTEAEKRQEQLNSIREKTVDGYVKEATQMEALTKKVKAGGLSFKEKENVLKEYNKTYGDTIGKAKTFEEAEKKIVEMGPKYIQMLALQAKAQAAFGLAVEASKKSLLAQTQNTDEVVTNWDRFKAGFTSFEGFFKGTENSMETLAQQRRNSAEKIAESDKDYFLNMQKEINDELAKMSAETGINLAGNDPEKAKKDGKKVEDVIKAGMEERKALREKELIDLEKAGQTETQAYIDKQNQIVDIQKEIDLIGVKGINQRALIMAEAEQKAAANQKELDLKNAEDRNNLRLTELRNWLAVEEEGSKEALDVRKKILEEESAIEKRRILDSVANEELRAAMILEVNQKLKKDTEDIDKESERKNIQYDNEIKELQRAGEIISLQRRLIGEKDKEVITRINKEISGLRLQAIKDEFDINQQNFDKGLISKEEYEKARIAITNKYSDAENAQLAEGFAEREKLQKESLDRRMKQVQTLLMMLGKSVDVTLDTSAFKTGIDEALNSFQTFKAISESDMDGPEKRAAMISAGIVSTQNILNQAFADASQNRVEAMNEELQLLQDTKAKELENKNLTEEQKAEIDRRYREKEKQVRLKAWEAEKQAKKEQAIINGALAITNILATVPKFDFGISTAIMIGAAIATTALQVAAINKAKPPKFRHGVIDLDPLQFHQSFSGTVGIQGPGTTTSDSIPAWVSKGESVIAAGPTEKWKDALTAINNNQFENYLIQKVPEFIYPSVPESVPVYVSSSSFEIDYDKLAMAIASKMPEPTYVENTIDERGLHQFVKKGNTTTEYKNKRYSMK